MWWHNLDHDIEIHVKGCTPCQINQNMPTQAPVHHWENAAQPWTRVHIDFAGPFMGKVFLLMVDSYSKWIEAYPLSPTNYGSNATIECLRTSYVTHGLPQIIVSDNGTSFTSNEFSMFMKENGICHVFSAPYHPATNGSAERAVQTFKNAMRKRNDLSSPYSLQTRINHFLFAYRTTPQTATELTPAELLMGRILATRLHLLKPNLGRRLLTNHNTDLHSGSQTRTLKEGDEVWMRVYNSSTKSGHWEPLHRRVAHYHTL